MGKKKKSKTNANDYSDGKNIESFILKKLREGIREKDIISLLNEDYGKRGVGKYQFERERDNIGKW